MLIQRFRQQGSVMAEFSVGIFIFFALLVLVIEFCHALWDYSTLVEAARRGARYAVTHARGTGSDPATNPIKNVVVYASPTGPGPGVGPALRGLTLGMIDVTYRNLDGTPALATVFNSDVVVTVSI